MRVFNFPFWRFYFYKMPRYYNRRYKRRYSKRKTTGAKNVFMNRSAKSQAKQIYSLSKRVNSVYRACKPEYKLFSGTNESYNFNSGAVGSTYQIITFNGPFTGVGDDNFTGNKTRSIALNLYFTGEYYNDSTTGYHNSESAGTPFRIVILQRKRPSQSTVSISDILSSSSGSGADYTMQAVCPLKRGITEDFRVLKDYKFTFTITRNQKILKLKCRPNNFRWDTSANCNGIVILLTSAGLHWDTNFKEYVEGVCKVDYVYTDA